MSAGLSPSNNPLIEGDSIADTVNNVRNVLAFVMHGSTGLQHGTYRESDHVPGADPLEGLKLISQWCIDALGHVYQLDVSRTRTRRAA
jgi:hypothetical protein